MTQYIRFNLICLLLILFFTLGTGLHVRAIIATIDVDQYLPKGEEASSTSSKIVLGERNLAPVSFGTTSEQEIAAAEDDIADILTPKEPQPLVTGPLPAKIHLDVPFTSQAPEKNWDQPWQDACEEAAILMMDAYYKGYGLSPLFVKDEILKLVEWEEARGWGGSIPASHVIELYEYLSERSSLQELENPTAEDIKRRIASGHPVLVLADGQTLENPHFSGDGPVYHALVVVGYTESTFITNDPGTQFGKDFEYTYTNLLESIHDWNGGDVKAGRSIVLVQE